jgi:hypothetical protein
LLRAALREYHRSHVRVNPKPLDLLATYIGAGEGPEDLSANYKSYLTEALERKIPLVAHDGDSPKSPPLTT